MQTQVLPSTNKPTLSEVADVFLRHGGLTFGGGTPTVAVLEYELVERRHWVERAQFRLANGLSRLTPGTNVLATCTALGWFLHGWTGVVAALLAASVPGAIVTLMMTAIYEPLNAHPIGRAFLTGVIAAAIGIMAGAVVSLVLPFIKEKSYGKVLLMTPTAAVLGFLGVSPLKVLAIGAASGLVIARFGRR